MIANTFMVMMIRNFYNKEVPKEEVLYTCLSIIIILDYIIKSNKYYPQTYLDECKYHHHQQQQQKNYIDEDFRS